MDGSILLFMDSFVETGKLHLFRPFRLKTAQTGRPVTAVTGKLCIVADVPFNNRGTDR